MNQLQTIQEKPIEKSVGRALSVDSAYELRHKEVQPKKPDAAPSKPAERTESHSDDYTSQEMATVRTLDQRELALQKHVESLNQGALIISKAEEQLSGIKDKGKASAQRQMIKEAREELKEQHNALLAERQSIDQTRLELQTNRHDRHIQRSKARLSERLPDLDKPALRRYLQGAGFSEDEIAQAYDARMVELAEKARRYDESKKEGNNLRIPTRKTLRQPVATDEVGRARERLRQSGKMDDAVRLLDARRAAR